MMRCKTITSNMLKIVGLPVKPIISRGLGAKLCACANASSAQNSQYAQLTHSAIKVNRVSDLRIAQTRVL